MKFPVPHDVHASTLPGTEGWERMYPYHYQFVTDDPARHAYEKETFWFYDGLHYPEPLYRSTRLGRGLVPRAVAVQQPHLHGTPVRGVDHRIINGYVYISPVPVKDAQEIGARVAQLHGARRLLLQELGRARGQVEGEDGSHHPRAGGAAHPAAGRDGGHEGRHRRPRRVRGLPPAEELRRPDQPRHQVLAVPLRVPEPGLRGLRVLPRLRAEAVPQHPGAARHPDDLGHRRDHVPARRGAEELARLAIELGVDEAVCFSPNGRRWRKRSSSCRRARSGSPR